MKAQLESTRISLAAAWFTLTLFAIILFQRWLSCVREERRSLCHYMTQSETEKWTCLFETNRHFLFELLKGAPICPSKRKKFLEPKICDVTLAMPRQQREDQKPPNILRQFSFSQFLPSQACVRVLCVLSQPNALFGRRITFIWRSLEQAKVCEKDDRRDGVEYKFWFHHRNEMWEEEDFIFQRRWKT